MLKRIAVIGPESTGKSMLCTQLAAHYNTQWVPEFARQYLEEHGSNYTYDDLLTIAQGQLSQEDEIAEQVKNKDGDGNSLLFVDTNMYVMKTWCEFVFGKCHRYILEQIARRHYDLYLLCDTDLPWVADTLREYPDLSVRQQLYKLYYDAMINQDVPWLNISGSYSERLKKAVARVNLLQ